MPEENKTNVKIEDLPKPESEQLTPDEAKDVQGGFSANPTGIGVRKVNTGNTIGGALGEESQNIVGGGSDDIMIAGDR